MVTKVVVAAAIFMSASAVKSSDTSERSFLVLSDQTVDFVGGVPVLGKRPIVRSWDAVQQRSIESIDGVEFMHGERFWKMIHENAAKNSVKCKVRVDRGGRVFYEGKPVSIGMEVGNLDSPLRWRDWIVGVGTAAGAPGTIKGPFSYFFWFDLKHLKGSYTQVGSGTTPSLRIYSK